MSVTQERLHSMCIGIDANIADAMRAIDAGALGISFITNTDFVLKGVVTDGDIRRALLGGKGLNAPVLSIANGDPVSAKSSMDPAKIAHLFSEKIRIIPVVDDQGTLVTIASFDKRVSIPVAAPVLGEQELLNVSECILSGWISSAGKFVTRFEELCAKYSGVEYAVSTSSGTTALHLALLTLGIGPGDEVIVPSLTFFSTGSSVVHAGATPIFVDSDPQTWNIDSAAIERAITKKTKAIIPVHLYGFPANMNTINSIADQHGLFVIEDAAEAQGALYNNRPVGGLGDVGVFSFYGNKVITTGEGGMLVTNNKDVATKARTLRDHGMTKERRYWHPEIGYNYRLTNLQAAVGVAQIEKIDQIVDQKIHIASLYQKYLKEIPGIIFPPSHKDIRNVYWLYSILINEDKFGTNRDALMQCLQSEGVDSRPFFPPLHKQPAFGPNSICLPRCEHLSSIGLNLPSSPQLREEEIKRICALISKQSRG